MFCKKCGAQMPDGQRFCSVCGTQLRAAEEQRAPAPEKRIENWTTPTEKPGKGKARFWVLGILSVVLVAAIVLGVVFRGQIADTATNLFDKTFHKEEYLKERELDNLERTMRPEENKDATSAVSVFRNSLRGAMDTDPEESREYTLKLSFNQKALSKDVLALLQKALANELGPEADMDFSWFKNVAISVDLDKDLKESLLGGSITAIVNDKDIISAFFCADFLEGKIYVQVPDLSAGYMVLDMSEMGYDASMAAMARERAVQMIEALGKVDEQKLEKIVLRYAEIILEDIGEGEIGKEELTAGGISGTYTATSVTINGKKILKIYKDVLYKLLDDPDVEEIFFIVTDELDYITEEQANQYFDQFIEEINDILDELEKADPEDFPYTIPMTVYTDSQGDIVGRSIKVRDEDRNVLAEINAYAVSSGRDYGLKAELKLDAELYVAGHRDLTLVLEGSGEKTLNKELTGSFDLNFRMVNPDSKDTLSLKLLKISLDAKAKTDYVDYRVNLAPTKDLIKVIKVALIDGNWDFRTNDQLEEALEEAERIMPEEAQPVVKMIESLSIDLRGVMSKDVRSAEIAVRVGKNDLLGLGLESHLIDSADIVIPDSAAAPDEWTRSLDTEKIFSVLGNLLGKLKDAGVPSSLIEMLRGAIF